MGPHGDFFHREAITYGEVRLRHVDWGNVGQTGISVSLGLLKSTICSGGSNMSQTIEQYDILSILLKNS